MSITIKSIKGYYFLDAWIFANIIQQATLVFCKKHLNLKNDPCGRMFDQMTMAARSAVANVAEGSSRRQTSKETEMKLTDVARASLSELLGDYFSFSLTNNVTPWLKESDNYKNFNLIQLAPPNYSTNIEYDAWMRIKNEYQKFAPWIEHPNIDVCLNSLMMLINRTISMLQKMIGSQLDTFKQEGGFTENLTQERRDSQIQQAEQDGAPSCPICGGVMIKHVAKRGSNSGREFWGCANYPNCKGTKNL